MSDPARIDDDAAIDRFRTLLRIPTMSRNAVEQTDWEAFDTFIATLPELYPHLHAALEREQHGHSLLYRCSTAGAAQATAPPPS
ncbi:hypothetical protein [Leifsonia sp. Le1]|uniref:hypothetical protein n=1 Tax=Leifsonia sp. Le1 TaxID=3404918 RepID=UPI003EBEACD7